jgi:hypothetical protein
MILNMYPTPDLAVNETEYTVQIAMSDGTGATAVLLPQLVYRVHLYPTGDAKSPWVVDDYIRVLSISG